MLAYPPQRPSSSRLRPLDELFLDQRPTDEVSSPVEALYIYPAELFCSIIVLFF